MVASPEYFEYYYKERRRLFVSPSITDNVRNSAYQESNKRKLIAKLGESYPYNDPGKIRELTSSYYAMIEEVDTWVGQFLRVLDRTGLRRNTMVVFTSDHGEMMGAHGMMNKAILLEEAARVPLIISSAGKLRKNVTIAEPVSHLDVHSTILDYMGAEEYDASDGTSLRRFIKQTSSNVEYDERFVVVEIDERFPVNDHQFSRSIGEVPNFMIRKGKVEHRTTPRHVTWLKNVLTLPKATTS
jgi:arylsulfatase A-like enzyme